jgi:alkylation response protein AidB-like acyl-CoA dehydrogenase
MPQTVSPEQPRKSDLANPPGEVHVIADKREALERAYALLLDVRSRGQRADEERRLPDETIETLRTNGLFAISTPRRFGGSELGVGVMVEVATALASACGSTGWVYGVLTGHNWMVSLFAEEAQREVFSDPRSLTATVFRLQGTTVKEDGGYRLTDGRGRFCSGIDYADWVIVGNAVQSRDGPPEDRYLILPKSEVEVIDDWRTVGMRGTCSRSIVIKDAFIPAHRTLPAADVMRGTTPGAQLYGANSIYAVPFLVAQPFSLVGAPLGIMAGAIDVFTESLKKKISGYGPQQVSEQGVTFAKLAEAAADSESARRMVLADCAQVDSGGEISRTDRTRILRNFAYAARTCRRVVSSLFEETGGSGIYSSSLEQRFWRDANSCTAHTAFNWNKASAEYARALLGLAPSEFVGPRR